MTVKVDRPAEVGEYDEGMQALLQLVWGDGFLSPGGADEVRRVLEGVDLHGCRVLDIGCGLGAIDVLLVKEHGAASVVGIDLEPDLVRRARERFVAAGVTETVQAQVVAQGPLLFPDGSFDVVFSKDSLVQIPDKGTIFAQIKRVLRPSGLLVMSDWLRGGEGEYSPELLEFFRLEGITYNMASIEQSRAALTAAGFVDIQIRDRNEWYRALAEREHASLAGECIRPSSSASARNARATLSTTGVSYWSCLSEVNSDRRISRRGSRQTRPCNRRMARRESGYGMKAVRYGWMMMPHTSPDVSLQ